MSNPTTNTPGTPTSTDPDELRAQIDATRARMSDDVNALSDYAAPANIAHRQAEKVRGKVGGAVTTVKDKVMGSASDTSTTASDAVSGAASSIGGAVQGAPGAVTSGTRGNPLAAGLIALGAGWLLGSLLPASAKETQAASAVKDHAGTVTAPLVDAAKQAAGNLKEPATQAAQSLKDSAVDAAGTVKDEGTSAARGTQERATQAKDTVQASRS